MKDVETYLREFSYPQEHIREIVRRAQEDAYKDGFNAAAHQMLATAEQTMERVQQVTAQAHATAHHG